MAARRSADDSDNPRRPVRSKGGPPVVPILAILLLIGAAVYIGMAVQKSQAKEPAPTSASDNAPAPFASVADEAPPDLSGRGARTGLKADESLLQDANWQAAKVLADEGFALAQLSKAADTAGDRPEFQKKAGEAEAKFSSAVEMTAIWEEELIEKHGDGDPVVKSIRKVRDRWFAQMRKLRAQAK